MSQIVYPFILSGGAGTRLWPLSRETRPKQFLKLVGEHGLLQQSCLRLNNPLFSSPTILCNDDHRFLVAEQLLELGLETEKIVLEPVGRNTAPAALISALITSKKDPNAIIILMPSDHVIKDNEGFCKTVEIGVEAAQSGNIVTFGVAPVSPETGYGYIETTPDSAHILSVTKFMEKPSKEKAIEFLKLGCYYWNSGIFMYSAKSMIAAFETHAPETLKQCIAALEKAKADLDFLRLEKTAYEQCENISLDYAIIEKIKNIKCVPLHTKWSDLGAFPAIWEQLEKDESGNALEGDVYSHNVKNSFGHSVDGTCLAMVGLENVIAIATKDVVLVTSRDHAQDVKQIVDQLKRDDREEATEHLRVYRPWGWYQRLSIGEGFQVKCLMVKPGAKLSLQSHRHRSEHWIVVAGRPEITLDDQVFFLEENKSTYIPLGAKHRIHNPRTVPAMLIEVQYGSYLKEDDIIRYEDDFGRIED